VKRTRTKQQRGITPERRAAYIVRRSLPHVAPLLGEPDRQLLLDELKLPPDELSPIQLRGMHADAARVIGGDRRARQDAVREVNRERTAERLERAQAWREQATAIWNRNRSMSVNAVALEILKQAGVPPPCGWYRSAIHAAIKSSKPG
jgi:hypothetical protein